MASRRKSTIPCMVRASELVDQDNQDTDMLSNDVPAGAETKNDWSVDKEMAVEDCEAAEDKPPSETQSKKLQGGYECKYCPYVTQNLNEFTEHVDMQHPNVILNPLYVCAECNFNTKKYDSLSEHNSSHHPGESNFKLKLMKRNNQTILEQSIEGGADVSSTQENIETDDVSGISISKMPIMKMGKNRSEFKKHIRRTDDSLLDNQYGINTSIPETNGISNDSLTHVMPSVQLPPNIHLLPKIPVPLNSNKYNSALDTNATLISSFNKFPYPTQAELSWLTAASKHPEEQIRIWFATQRLKHGISWSPEEVEEARKKMFNGTIQSVPQTFTVVPGSLTTTAKITQPIIQTALPCQILGQTGLVFTQVTNTPTVTVPSVNSFTVANANAPSPTLKRALQSPNETPEPKRQSTGQAASPSTPKLNSMPSSRHERKKTNEQISVLKASFVNSQFPDDVEVYRLIEATGLSRGEIKKWFSDHRYRTQKGIVHITSESIARDRLSGKSRRPYHYRELSSTKITAITNEQLDCLENSFVNCAYPNQGEIDQLRAETKLTRREIDLWFADRRKIRDSMEQAVLDSMGSEPVNNGLVKGTNTPSGKLSSSWSSPSVQYKTKPEQLHLLKSTFAKTQWPSPQEYDQLAAQTGLVRTEIVKWFKDNRCVLRTGSLRWMDQYRKHYERALEERRKFIKIIAATTVGKDILTRYFQEYNQLHEEDVELLANKSKMSSDQVKECFAELQEQAALNQLEAAQDDDKLDTESEPKDWSKSLHGDDEAISDGADSCSQTGQDDTQDEAADYDYESTSKDDLCV